MSNPTELPDLDRIESIAKSNGYLTKQELLSLVALARRAQPEGEAPQAVAMAPKFEGQFDSHQDWVNRASRVLTVRREPAVCIDAKGRRCYTGADMRRAEEEDAFPVRYFWECEMTAPVAQHAESGAQAEELRAALLELTATQRKLIDANAELAMYRLSPSAPGTPEAPKELGLDIAVAVNQRIGKYIAANKPALMLLNEEELAALYRFQETCEDSDSGGYDVDKEMMKRLAAIGAIESKGFGRYQLTEFGDFVVERAAQLDGGQEGSELNG